MELAGSCVCGISEFSEGLRLGVFDVERPEASFAGGAGPLGGGEGTVRRICGIGSGG